MPQENFAWKSDDDLVSSYLTAGERSAITRWQQSVAYVFEFHPGHTTGNPIYVRPVGNTDKSNLPKFDTLNCMAAMYDDINKFSNGAKLRQQLNNAAQTDLVQVVTTEWDKLQELARRYWNNEPVVSNRKTALDLWAEEETRDPEVQTQAISRTQLRKILGF
jgi:hypothetical protein